PGLAVGGPQVVRQVQGVQDQLGGLVDRVVVAVAERQPRRVEAAGAVADQVDDRVQFVGHGGARARLGSGAGKYSGGAVIMAALQVLREEAPPPCSIAPP